MVLLHCTSCHQDLSTNEAWCRYLIYFLCYYPDRFRTDELTGRMDIVVAICSPLKSFIILIFIKSCVETVFYSVVKG